MRQVELEPRVPNEQREKLVGELNQAVNTLGMFDVFKPGNTGVIEKDAREAAIDFAAAYGNCLFAGLPMERAPYDPAEILDNVALAAAASMHAEYEKLGNKWSKLDGLVPGRREQRARAAFQQYMRIAAAYQAIKLAIALYRSSVVYPVVPLDQHYAMEKENRLLDQEGWVDKIYRDARHWIWERAGQIREYVAADRVAWENSVLQEYQDVTRPLW